MSSSIRICNSSSSSCCRFSSSSRSSSSRSSPSRQALVTAAMLREHGFDSDGDHDASRIIYDPGENGDDGSCQR